MSDLAKVTKALETGITRMLAELDFGDDKMVALLVEIANTSDTDSTRVSACRLLHSMKKDAAMKIKKTVTHNNGDTETITEASGLLDSLDTPQIQQYKE
jgi:hypothetical protein